jgi:hypothetical protein
MIVPTFLAVNAVTFIELVVGLRLTNIDKLFSLHTVTRLPGKRTRFLPSLINPSMS